MLKLQIIGIREAQAKGLISKGTAEELIDRLIKLWRETI
jgi:hypothetical protein